MQGNCEIKTKEDLTKPYETKTFKSAIEFVLSKPSILTDYQRTETLQEVWRKLRRPREIKEIRENSEMNMKNSQCGEKWVLNAEEPCNIVIFKDNENLKIYLGI